MSTTVDLGKITASVTVGTTTTGAAGTNASVSNSGTTQDAVLNFTIPRGAQGVQGPQGSTGPQGPAGPTGPQGPMGDVAVITPEQQAAFTMYSTTGQNTNGPMTQKATTDALNTAVANSLAQATARMGYGEATASNNAYSVAITNYTLPTNGGVVRVKMPTAATGAATLDISSTGAKTIYYNGAAVSAQNTWEADEIISVFYDGTRFMASNSQGGGGNLKIVNSLSDFDIRDESGYVLVKFTDGHIKTKYFNSGNVNIETDNDPYADLDILDENGNVLVRFSNGHVRTKKFDSAEYDGNKNHWDGKKWYGFGTSITNVSNEGKYAMYLAKISGMIFVNKGHSGGGITTSSNQTVYNDIMTSNLSDADIITLEVGANDGNAPLGTIYDGLSNSNVQDNSTFCGALNLCIRHLQATTNAQIVVMSSPAGRYQYQHPENKYDGSQTSGSDNHTTLERDECIRKVCMLNACYYIPAGCEDGMGYARMNASNDYNVDQVHQTDLGGYNFAQAIWSRLKNIPLFYTVIPS